MERQTLIFIADYGTGDPAFTEVILQLQGLLPHATILPVSTPPFSTINTGYWIYQFALTPNLKQTYIYSNTAPRKEDKEAQTNNQGEKLMYAQLTNGFEVIAVNAGYCFSFIKPHIQDLYYVNVENEGSQFRSRDKYPKAVAQMINKDQKLIGLQAELDLIPDAPQSVIASIDGYGNLKTSIRSSNVSYQPGQKLQITIGKTTKEATFTNGIFNIKTGEVAFSPGSSGHTDRFMEVFLRGGNAHALFDQPEIESHIEVMKKS